jgi:hypothetical protein
MKPNHVVGNSLSWRKNSLFGAEVSLFDAEQGIARSTPELQRKWTP